MASESIRHASTPPQRHWALLLAHRDVGAGEERLQAVEEVPVGEVRPQNVL